MKMSRLQGSIKKRKQNDGDFLADAIVDLCFVTSYKIEELIIMPPSRLNRLLERFKFHYCEEDK